MRLKLKQAQIVLHLPLKNGLIRQMRLGWFQNQEGMAALLLTVDIAFEFASWISPEFKLYLITEFQRLKDDENDRLKLEWNLQRTLAKVNYRIHTDAARAALKKISFQWI